VEPPWWENIIDIDPESACNCERHRGWRRGVFGQYEDPHCDPEKHKDLYFDRIESPFRQFIKDPVREALLKNMAEARPPRGSHLASVHFKHPCIWGGLTSKHTKHSCILNSSTPLKSRSVDSEKKGKKKDTSIHLQEWDKADRVWLLRNFPKGFGDGKPPELIQPWCLTCERELPWNYGHVPACCHRGMDANTFHMPVKVHVTVVQKSKVNRVQPMQQERPIQNALDIAPGPVLESPSEIPSAAPSLNPTIHDHEELVHSGPEVAPNPVSQPSSAVQSLSPTLHYHDSGAELQRTLCRALNEGRTVAEFGYYPKDLSALLSTGCGSPNSSGSLKEKNRCTISRVEGRTNNWLYYSTVSCFHYSAIGNQTN
jgi:hypothetical protein